MAMPGMISGCCRMQPKSYVIQTKLDNRLAGAVARYHGGVSVEMKESESGRRMGRSLDIL